MTEEPLPPGGTVRVITRWGEPVMHRRLARVTDFGDELHTLVADMAATMYAADGVGLAANQIGVDQAVFVFDCPDDSGRRGVGAACNPVLVPVTDRHRRLDDGEEGCLSLPGAFMGCPRPEFARVEGVGLDGSSVSFEGDGLLGRCLQHEVDHLEGMVFADRLPTRARKKLFREAEERAEEFPPDWPVSPRLT